MALSDEEMRQIEAEEFRRVTRERLERSIRVEADVRTTSDQRLEVRGLGSEIYGDAKKSVKTVVKGAKQAGRFPFDLFGDLSDYLDRVPVWGWLMLFLVLGVAALVVGLQVEATRL
jgi:hypothetical protein